MRDYLSCVARARAAAIIAGMLALEGCAGAVGGADAGVDGDLPDVVSTDIARPDAADATADVTRDAGADVVADVPGPDVQDAAVTRCSEGTIEIARMPPRAVGLSLATSGGNYALTWEAANATPEVVVQLAILDADARPLASRTVPPGSTVVALTDGFGLVTPTSFTPLALDGTPRGPTVDVALGMLDGTIHAPRVVRQGDVLYAVAATGSGSGAVPTVVTWPASGAGAPTPTPFVLNVGAMFACVGFGPSRVLVLNNGAFGETAHLRELALEGSAVVTRFDRVWTGGPEVATRAAWDEARGAWLVTGGTRVAGTRTFIEHVWRVDEAGTSTAIDLNGPNVYERPKGDLALGSGGGFALVYGDAYNASPNHPALVDPSGAVRVVPSFGSGYTTTPSVVWNGLTNRYAVLFGIDASGTTGETRLGLRCDLAF